jgi:hypothetical protein
MNDLLFEIVSVSRKATTSKHGINENHMFLLVISNWHNRCLIVCVLKTAQLIQFEQPSSAGKISRLLIALLLLAAISSRAGESHLNKTLAMAKKYSASTPTTFPPTLNLEKKPAPTPAPLMKLEDKTEIEFLSTTHLEKQTKSESRNRNFSLKVGYGEIWHGQSEMEKIPDDQRPESFAYFKAGFSF